jgi:hypothetical protein
MAVEKRDTLRVILNVRRDQTKFGRERPNRFDRKSKTEAKERATRAKEKGE